MAWARQCSQAVGRAATEPDRDLVEPLPVELDAEAGPGGHGDVAVDDVDRLGDDVAGPEPPRRRDVAGQREPVEGGEGGVGGAADARLEHPAAPHRDAALAAQVVDAPRREVAADPARLDVDDLRRAELDGVGGDGQRGDRLVEAHRRGDRLGQLGVPEEVVLGQRLLDQQQVELVEAGRGARRRRACRRRWRRPAAACPGRSAGAPRRPARGRSRARSSA